MTPVQFMGEGELTESGGVGSVGSREGCRWRLGGAGVAESSGWTGAGADRVRGLGWLKKSS